MQNPSCHQKIFYTVIVFSYFHHILFMGLRDPKYESWNLYLKHSFNTYICLSNNSLISAWTSTKFVSTLMLYQTNNFQHKPNTSMYLRDIITLYVDRFHTLLNHLNEISDTQTTYIDI